MLEVSDKQLKQNKNRSRAMAAGIQILFKYIACQISQHTLCSSHK